MYQLVDEHSVEFANMKNICVHCVHAVTKFRGEYVLTSAPDIHPAWAECPVSPDGVHLPFSEIWASRKSITTETR
jgi:hypothetical protein